MWVVRQGEGHKLRGDRRNWRQDSPWSCPGKVTMALNTADSCNLYITCHTKRCLQGTDFCGTWNVGGGLNQADGFPRKPRGKRNSAENNHGGLQFPWAMSGIGNRAERRRLNKKANAFSHTENLCVLRVWKPETQPQGR